MPNCKWIGSSFSEGVLLHGMTMQHAAHQGDSERRHWFCLEALIAGGRCPSMRDSPLEKLCNECTAHHLNVDSKAELIRLNAILQGM